MAALKKGDKINTYTLTSDFKAEGGRSESASAVDNAGNKYFVKKLTNYSFPPEEMRRKSKSSEDTYQRSLKYVQHQIDIYEKLTPFAQGGTLVLRNHFEIIGCFGYSVFPYVKDNHVKVHELPMEERLRILKLTAQGVLNLHKIGLVHADLKPQNVLLEKNVSGYSPKIIDFDDSFFENATPSPTDLIADEKYYSPELAIYYFSEGKKSFDVDKSCITKKIDVFTLGILFCEFLTGKKPSPCKKEQTIFGSVFEAIPKGMGLKSLKGKQVLTIPETDIAGNPIPIRVQEIVNNMLFPWYEDRPSMTQVLANLSMAGMSVKPDKPKLDKKWKCKKCGTLNDLKDFRCKKDGEIRPLNPEYVNA